MLARPYRVRRWRIMKPLTFTFAAIFCNTLATAAIAFPVTWTFVETRSNCTFNPSDLFSMCDNLNLPAAVAQLSLPNIEDNGTYHSVSTGPTISETGDRDFFFQWDNDPFFMAPVDHGCLGDCLWDISFASSASALDVFIHFGFESSTLSTRDIDLGPTGGSIGATGESRFSGMPGCGFDATCDITGFWTLTAVPEPSSLGVLGTASAIFLLGLRRCRRRAL